MPVMPRIRWESGPSRAPLMAAAPDDGTTRPASMRTVVVLPAPLGPSRPKISPSPTVKFRSRTASTAPKRLPRPCTSIIDPPSGAWWVARPRTVAGQAGQDLPVRWFPPAMALGEQERTMAERTVASQRAFEGRLLRLRVDEVALDDGRRASREVVEHPGAVAILPWDGHRLSLVRQWRHAAGRALLEVPAGTLDGGEAPAVAARREMAEEVELAADHWEQ